MSCYYDPEVSHSEYTLGKVSNMGAGDMFKDVHNNIIFENLATA